MASQVREEYVAVKAPRPAPSVASVGRARGGDVSAPFLVFQIIVGDRHDGRPTQSHSFGVNCRRGLVIHQPAIQNGSGADRIEQNSYPACVVDVAILNQRVLAIVVLNTPVGVQPQRVSTSDRFYIFYDDVVSSSGGVYPDAYGLAGVDRSVRPASVIDLEAVSGAPVRRGQPRAGASIHTVHNPIVRLNIDRAKKRLGLISIRPSGRRAVTRNRGRLNGNGRRTGIGSVKSCSRASVVASASNVVRDSARQRIRIHLPRAGSESGVRIGPVRARACAARRRAHVTVPRTVAALRLRKMRESRRNEDRSRQKKFSHLLKP
jgi:hypothetical protein